MDVKKIIQINQSNRRVEFYSIYTEINHNLHQKSTAYFQFNRGWKMIFSKVDNP
jgi:hypothetical protein